MKSRAWMAMLVLLSASAAMAQTLRFDEYREQQIPDYANLRIGPFFSDVAVSLSAGYRYVTTSGEGSRYLYQNDRGRIIDDGSDFPLIARVNLRNYLIISKYMDLDVSFTLGYQFFPMGTEDNEFLFDVVGPAVFARMGSFSFMVSEDAWQGSFNGRQASAYVGDRGSAVSANVSSDFQLTPLVRGRIYDIPSYRTDYVDERGYVDNVSGDKYTVFQNMLGLDMDWLMAKDKNLAYSGSRVDTLPQDDEFDIQRSVVYNQGLAYQKQINPVAVGGGRANGIWRLYDAGRGDQFQQDYSAFLGADLSEDTSLQLALGYSMAELTAANQWETNGTSDAVIGMIQVLSRLTERLSHQAGYSKSQRGGFSGGFEVVDAFNYGITWANPDLSIGFRTEYQAVEARLYRSNDYTDWFNQLTVVRPLTQYLTLTLATAYTMRDNGDAMPGDVSVDSRLLQESYDTWASNIGLAYALARHWTVNTYVEHFERFSDAEDVAFTRDMAGVTLTYARDF